MECCGFESLFSCKGKGSCNIFCCNCDNGCKKPPTIYDRIMSGDVEFRSVYGNIKKPTHKKYFLIFFIFRKVQRKMYME